jgi:hypothetical protein
MEMGEESKRARVGSFSRQFAVANLTQKISSTLSKEKNNHQSRILNPGFFLGRGISQKNPEAHAPGPVKNNCTIYIIPA